MVKTKISLTLSAIVVALLAFLVFSPRYANFGIPSNSVVHNLIYKILYLSGPIEQVGNVILFIPLFVVVARLYPVLSLRYVSLICIFASGLVETFQMWIPGRVSAISDFLGNAFGVVTAQLFFYIFPRIRDRIRGVGK